MSCTAYCDSSTLTPVFGLVLLDRGVERVVLGLVEALDPPHGELVLGEARGGGQGDRHAAAAANTASHCSLLRYCHPLRAAGANGYQPDTRVSRKVISDHGRRRHNPETNKHTQCIEDRP